MATRLTPATQPLIHRPAWKALMKAQREQMIARMWETVQSGGAAFAGERSLISQLL